VAAAALAEFSVPVYVPGGKPVIEVPGETPKLPVRTLEPLLVTADAPNTAYVAAEANGLGAGAGVELIE
jgi:hypothetical protein